MKKMKKTEPENTQSKENEEMQANLYKKGGNQDEKADRKGLSEPAESPETNTGDKPGRPEQTESLQIETETAANQPEQGEGEPSLTETAAPEEGGTIKQTEIEAMLAEAEQRGYLRGRNEQIEKLMASPQIEEAGIEEAPGETYPMILSNIRPSIWDL